MREILLKFIFDWPVEFETYEEAKDAIRGNAYESVMEIIEIE